MPDAADHTPGASSSKRAASSPVTLPGAEGQLTMPRHAPLMAALQPGELVLRKAGREVDRGLGAFSGARRQGDGAGRHGGALRRSTPSAPKRLGTAQAQLSTAGDIDVTCRAALDRAQRVRRSAVAARPNGQQRPQG